MVVTRVIDAPRAMVWEACTAPKEIVKWWGPRGFTTTIHEMNVRPGGLWKSIMRGPDGTEYLNNCVFTEAVEPERIVYNLVGGRKEDGDVHARVSLAFEAQGEKTKVTLRMRFATDVELERSAKKYKAAEGGNEMLDRLQEYLANGVVVY